MIVLLAFAFLSGIITIAAPCIWPLLPIVLSASATGGKRKPLGITIGVMLSFGLVTLALSALVKVLPFDTNLLRYVAVCIIVVLGVALIIPQVSAWIEAWASKLIGKLGVQTQKRTGFGAGILTGLALGIVWAPCAGPILATIISVSATQTVTLSVVALTVAYVTGIGVPLFGFAMLGNVLVRKSKWLNKYLQRVQQVFGIIMIVTAVGIALNYDKAVQVALLNAFPGYGAFVNQFESNTQIQNELDKIRNSSSTVPTQGTAAPELVGITNWLNSNPLTLADLRGKVVLIDFWTYTCINCIRTLPHLTGWYERYKDQGFVVIGVHSPEFEFEKSTENVQQALQEYQITYPVAQDNNFSTWQNYDNRYWPAEYLIDAQGNIRKTHFGEGKYDEMEEAIKALLVENGVTVEDSMLNMPDATPRYANTPESYLGQGRMERFASEETIQLGEQEYHYPSTLNVHQLAYSGIWRIASQYAEAREQAKVKLRYRAADVYIVLTPTSDNARVSVLLDNQPISTEAAGEDIEDSVIRVTQDRLYHVVHTDGVEEHTLELIFDTPGTQAFAFTFGG